MLSYREPGSAPKRNLAFGCCGQPNSQKKKNSQRTGPCCPLRARADSEVRFLGTKNGSNFQISPDQTDSDPPPPPPPPKTGGRKTTLNLPFLDPFFFFTDPKKLT